MADRPGQAGAAYLGVDVGTSGVRACALDASGRLLAEADGVLEPPVVQGRQSEQAPAAWWRGLVAAVSAVANDLEGYRPVALAVDSTSGTLVLADGSGHPLRPALLYNDRRATAAAADIAASAPAESGAHGASSGLAKLRHLHQYGETARAAYALHAADWLSGRLTGRFGVSDENNALKLGYDPVTRAWPAWVGELVPEALLPEVVAPGTRLGCLSTEVAAVLGLPAGLTVHAGTTDSVAAFLATGAAGQGEAVTSLGSTLALKVVSDHPVFAPRYGVYSHRLGPRWLPGGASNSGGAVLLQHFSKQELADLTPCLDPDRPTGLDYLPLPGPGERFPDSDPELQPRLTPVPEDRVRFLQGLLEGIAAIEARGYRRLAELGAPYPVSVRTAGGGAANPAWTRIRQGLLEVPMTEADSTEAACGAARLAMGPVT
jgi:hypothetical protein